MHKRAATILRGEPASAKGLDTGSSGTVTTLLWIGVALSAAAVGLARAEAGGACREISEPSARLACYDRAAEAQSSHPGKQDNSATPAKGPPPAARDSAGESDDYIEARIADVQQTSLGQHRFRLDNGQLWERADSRAMTLQEQDRVRIRQTLFGGWQMRERDGSSRSVKVRRLR